MPEIILKTPWWVYVLWISLMALGLGSLRRRKIHVMQLLGVPIILSVWNLVWLGERIHEHYGLLIYWLAGIGFGFPFGEKSVSHWKVLRDKHHKYALLPPTYSTMILILIVFAIRYFFYFNYETYPDMGPSLYPADTAISGFLTGIFAGRTYEIFKKYKIL